MPLVRRAASSIVRKLPLRFSIDDLVGDGCIGLLRAVDRYEPKHGIPFDAWAARIVRGAILNGLRAMDLVPERLRRDARTLDANRWQLAQARGRSPSDQEAARQAGIDERRLCAVLLALRRAAMISIDAPLQTLEEGDFFSDRLASDDPDPAERVVMRDRSRSITSAVDCLPRRERFIIGAFYAGNKNFREIGRHLGISKQRVSQLHTRAIVELRARLAPLVADA